MPSRSARLSRDDKLRRAICELQNQTDFDLNQSLRFATTLTIQFIVQLVPAKMLYQIVSFANSQNSIEQPLITKPLWLPGVGKGWGATKRS